MDGKYNLAIVAGNSLIFEAEFFCDSDIRSASGTVIETASFSRINRDKSSVAHLKQLVLYAALDMTEEAAKKDENHYLKAVDDFNNYKIFAWMTACGTKLLLLYEVPPGLTKGRLNKIEENIKRFFTKLNMLYVTVISNPMYELNDIINARNFDEKLENIARTELFGLQR